VNLLLKGNKNGTQQQSAVDQRTNRPCGQVQGSLARARAEIVKRSSRSFRTSWNI
jgi:hypothetical protein